jgi:hypothetical protein
MNQPNQYDAVLGGCSPGPPPGGAILGITNKYSEPEHRQFCLDAASVASQALRRSLLLVGPVCDS